MATDSFDTYVFENGQFAPFQDAVKDQLEYLDYLEQQGYARQEQVWGQYPDAYIKVYEAKRDAPALFKYTAVLESGLLPAPCFRARPERPDPTAASGSAPLPAAQPPRRRHRRRAVRLAGRGRGHNE